MRFPFGRRGRDNPARRALEAELRRDQLMDGESLADERKTAVRAKLAGADLSGADLRFADLRECNLRGANLRGAKLSGADLTWADLKGANLEGADFGRAILVEACLEATNLASADLSRVTGLSWASVRGATGTSSTSWPTGFSTSAPQVAGPLIH